MTLGGARSSVLYVSRAPRQSPPACRLKCCASSMLLTKDRPALVDTRRENSTAASKMVLALAGLALAELAAPAFVEVSAAASALTFALTLAVATAAAVVASAVSPPLLSALSPDLLSPDLLSPDPDLLSPALLSPPPLPPLLGPYAPQYILTTLDLSGQLAPTVSEECSGLFWMSFSMKSRSSLLIDGTVCFSTAMSFTSATTLLARDMPHCSNIALYLARPAFLSHA